MDLAKVIKYEGDNTTFVWKHPAEDFNIYSQLIVHESQEALFFKDGQALDLFGAGRHTLKTQNIPLIGKFFNKLTNDETPFHCEVYFINKTEQMAIKWGTDSKIEFIEPTYNFPLAIGASGEMSLRVEDSRRLVIKLVGTETILDQKGLTRVFRSFLQTRVKSYIARVIKEQKLNIFEIDQHLDTMSAALKQLLAPDFATYGVALESFMVGYIAKPDGEPQYDKFKELHFRQYADIAEAKLKQQVTLIEAETEAQKTVMYSKAMATKRAQEGYTYQQERGFDVSERIASNDAVAQYANVGMGLGALTGFGGSIGNVVSGAVTQAVNNQTFAAAQNAADPIVGAIINTTVSNNATQAVNETATNLPTNTTVTEKTVSEEPAQQPTGAATVIAEPKITCPNCQAVMQKNAKFCSSCGTAIPQPEPETKIQKCSECGEVLPEGAKFCANCGAMVEQQRPTKCPECGEKIIENAKFCANCGHKI